jgi:apolipoprotein N-acyltransferase
MIARADTLPVAVIQPNVTQAFKWDPASAAATYRKVNVLIAEAEREDPALVVGPEACLPFAVSEGSTRLPAEIAAGTRPLLLGVVTGIGEGRRGKLDGHPVTVYRRHYNSALLVDADRTVLDRHDKQYLVPFTEQVPYKRVLGFVLPMMRKQFGKFVPAADLHLLTVPGQPRPVRFGALVCYESLFPALVARLRGMGADFMVNVTNDAWFGRSTFPYQHAGMSTLRAIENRVSIVRAANTGVSAFYDPLGRPGLRTGIFRNGALVGLVTLSSAGPTVLARIGHLLLVPVYGGVLLFLWLRFRAHRRGTGVDSVEALE